MQHRVNFCCIVGAIAHGSVEHLTTAVKLADQCGSPADGVLPGLSATVANDQVVPIVCSDLVVPEQVFQRFDFVECQLLD